MIRTRSSIVMVNTEIKDSSSPTAASSSMSTSGFSRTPGGQKLWLCLNIVLCIGVVVYVALMVSSNPVQVKRLRKHSSSSKEAITVVMNTFKRYDMMEDAVEFYASCDLVKFVYIVWSEKENPPQRIAAKYAFRKHPEISFIVHKNDSLNNRFKPIESPHSDAIFSVDDDMRVSCRDLNTAFEAWKGNQRSMVGFMPRLHLRANNGDLIYRCWWRVWWHGMYSIILTKAALFHRDFLHLYTNVMSQSIRELVDEERNCEDLAMQFLMANVTSLPPLYVKGNLQDLGALNGISTSYNFVSAKHMDKRSECLNLLVTIYGRNPLVMSHIIVDSAANGWTNSPSTWQEYISSDLWKLF